MGSSEAVASAVVRASAKKEASADTQSDLSTTDESSVDCIAGEFPCRLTNLPHRGFSRNQTNVSEVSGVNAAVKPTRTQHESRKISRAVKAYHGTLKPSTVPTTKGFCATCCARAPFHARDCPH